MSIELKPMKLQPAQEPVKKPHKHAELIKQWADGAEIEVDAYHNNNWQVASRPTWNEDLKYRIYQEPKPDVVEIWCGQQMDDLQKVIAPIKEWKIKPKLIWDSEGNLKDAEVLK